MKVPFLDLKIAFLVISYHKHIDLWPIYIGSVVPSDVKKNILVVGNSAKHIRFLEDN